MVKNNNKNLDKEFIQKNNNKNLNKKFFQRNDNKNLNKKFFQRNDNKNLNKKFFQRNDNDKYYLKNSYNLSHKNKKPEKPKITNYLYRNKKFKKGIFLKKPSFNDILYPFPLNLKLINEYFN